MLSLLMRKSVLTAQRYLASMPLSALADVDIDPTGVFKYILIQCKEGENSKYIVRGYGRCTFHADIYDEVKQGKPKDVKTKCVGGGRIRRTPEKKELFVYGYSQGYGQADHTITVGILKKEFPDYNVEFSNDGY